MFAKNRLENAKGPGCSSQICTYNEQQSRTASARGKGSPAVEKKIKLSLKYIHIQILVFKSQWSCENQCSAKLKSRLSSQQLNKHQ